jgi:hypothetical protein
MNENNRRLVTTMARARTTALAAALCAGGPAAAQSNAELARQIEELKKQVAELLKAQQAGAAKPPPAATQENVAITQPVPKPPSEEPATKADINGLRGDLESYKYEQQRARETKTALTTRGTTIGGTVQVRASWQDQGAVGAGTTTPNTSTSTSTAIPRRSSFDIPQAQINLGGSLYRDYAEGRNLDYRLQLAYQTNAAAGFAGTSPNGSQLNLNDAYLRYSFFPTTSGLEDPKLTLTVGQQLLPFGLEAQVGEELRPVINSALFLSGLGIGTRQIGAIVRGDIEPYVDYGANYRAPLVEYALGITNGLDAGQNKSDTNGAKDFMGRVAFTLPVDYYSLLRELKLGLSYYDGKKNLTRTSSGTTSTITVGRARRRGLDLYYNHNPYGITYEYADGRDEALAGSSGASTAVVNSRGQYLTLYYQWGEQFVASYRAQAKYDDWWPKTYQAFLRFDQFDPNTSTPNDGLRVTTLGLNVFFAETTKFQINLARNRYENPALKNSTALLGQFQFGF